MAIRTGLLKVGGFRQIAALMAIGSGLLKVGGFRQIAELMAIGSDLLKVGFFEVTGIGPTESRCFQAHISGNGN